MLIHMLLNATSSAILLVIPVLENLHSEGAVVAIIGLAVMVILLGLMTVSGFILFDPLDQGEKVSV